MRTAIFPGSFDPFTIGHADIVARALPLFDKIVIAIGVNEEKSTMFTSEQRLRQISELYAGEPRVAVIAYDGLTIEAARSAEAQWILRGVRSVADFEYERTLADINRRLSGIETLLLYTSPEHSHVSSSIVRDLLRHHHDASSLLPAGLSL